MLFKSLLVTVSVLVAALIVPSLASAYGLPENGSTYYSDQPPTIGVEGMGHALSPVECGIQVTGPDGFSTSAGGYARAGARCNLSVTMPTPSAPGTYSWRYTWYALAAGFGQEWDWQTFTIVERPAPTPPAPSPQPPAPTPPPAPAPTPPSPPAAPTSATVASVTDNSVTISIPTASWGFTYYVYRPDGSLLISTAGGHTATVYSLACGTSYGFKVERRDYSENLLGTETLTVATSACAVNLPQPAPPNEPSPPAPTVPAPVDHKARVWAFKSTGRVGQIARIRVATEAGAGYTRYVVKVMSKHRSIATLRVSVRTKGLAQVIAWRVPRSLRPGTLHFSVQAYGAGSSRKASAPLVLTTN